MANYNLRRTDGLGEITVTVGSRTGPSTETLVPIVDLDLYGLGALNWGKGIEQNLLRLLEHFACPQVVRSAPNPNGPDFTGLRPVNRDDAAIPGQYNPNVDSHTGINAPVLGQLWFNTTNGKLYRCIDADEGNADRFAASQNALWDVVAADPDLYLKLTGGTMSGPCLLYTSPSPRDRTRSRMPSSA